MTTWVDPFAVDDGPPAEQVEAPPAVEQPRRTGPTARTLRIRRAQRAAICPTCKAAAGEPCRDGDTPRDTNHPARVRVAREAREAGRTLLEGADRYGRQHESVGGPGASGDECPECDEPMLERSGMTMRKGKWIHKACAPGADD